MPEVWLAYGKNKEQARNAGLLLVPNVESSVRKLVLGLRVALAPMRGGLKPEEIFLAYNESHVVAHLTFEELLRAALPLSVWWNDSIDGADIRPWLQRLKERPDLPKLLLEPAQQIEGLPPDVLDMIRVAGAIALDKPLGQDREYFQELLEALEHLFADFKAPERSEDPPPLWSVFSCRPVQSAVSQSRASVKADAAIRLFDLSCKELIWAVIDSGIDADHDAFLEWPAQGKHQPLQ
jgi:hypothetical protein